MSLIPPLQSVASKSIPSMKQFLHWKEVTRLYRSFLRLVQGHHSMKRQAHIIISPKKEIEHESLKSLKQQIQDSFRRNLSLKESIDIQRAIQEGNRQYKQLLLMVSPANIGHGNHMHNHTHDKVLDFKGGKEDKVASSSIHDEEDVIGRVGVQWPWERRRDSK